MSFIDRETFFLGVVALPSPEVSRCALEIAARIAACTRLSSCVHAEQRVPHVTLYQGCFPIEQSAQVVDRPLRYALSFQMQDVLELRPNGNVFWNVTPNDALMKTHLHLHAELQPLTNGRLVERFRRMADDPDCSEAERTHIRTYGSPLAGPQFAPHITLGCAMDPLQAEGIVREICPPPDQSFSVSELRIAVLQDDGSIYRVLSL